jgi:hypothetical protein
VIGATHAAACATCTSCTTTGRYKKYSSTLDLAAAFATAAERTQLQTLWHQALTRCIQTTKLHATIKKINKVPQIPFFGDRQGFAQGLDSRFVKN